MKPLTSRQAEILGIVSSYQSQRGKAPTLREIGAVAGIRSTNGVTDHIKALKKKGMLNWDPTLSRSIVLTKEGVTFVRTGVGHACPYCGCHEKPKPADVPVPDVPDLDLP